MTEYGRARILEARECSREQFEAGRGNSLPSVRGTLWAAYNGVAEFLDHRRTPANRLDSVWFGTGYVWKARAYCEAVAKLEAWKN